MVQRQSSAGCHKGKLVGSFKPKQILDEVIMTYNKMYARVFTLSSKYARKEENINEKASQKRKVTSVVAKFVVVTNK